MRTRAARPIDVPHREPSAAAPHPNALLAALLLGAVSYSLLQSLVVPALPTLQRDLHASTSGVAWVFTAFMLSTVVTTPLAGRLGDMLGKKRMLVAMLVVLAAGTLLGAVAKSLPLLVAARTIQGVGGAIFPLAFGIIRDELPPRRVASGIALVSSVLGLGGVCGIVLAGPILEHLSYHWLFWVPLAGTVAALAATVAIVPESRVRTGGSLAWGAALAFSAALAILLVGVSKAPDWGWTGTATLACGGAAVLLALAWVVADRRARHPYVDLRVMLLPGTRAANLSAFLIGWGLFTGFVLIPLYVQAAPESGYGFDLSVTQAGLFLLPWASAVFLASPVGGRMSARAGSKWPLAIGSAVAVVGFLWLLAEHARPWEVYVATGIIGTGVGLAFSALANLVVESVEPTDTAVASGVNLIARNVGGVVGTQVGVSVVAGTVTAGGYATERGYLAVFVLCAVMLGLGGGAALLAPGRRAVREPHVDEEGLAGLQGMTATAPEQP